MSLSACWQICISQMPSLFLMWLLFANFDNWMRLWRDHTLEEIMLLKTTDDWYHSCYSAIDYMDVVPWCRPLVDGCHVCLGWGWNASNRTCFKTAMNTVYKDISQTSKRGDWDVDSGSFGMKWLNSAQLRDPPTKKPCLAFAGPKHSGTKDQTKHLKPLQCSLVKLKRVLWKEIIQPSWVRSTFRLIITRSNTTLLSSYCVHLRVPQSLSF